MRQPPLEGTHQLFKYLERLRDDGWESVPPPDGAASPPDFAFARLSPVADATGMAGLLRVRFEMAAPLGEVVRILRPEVIFHPRRAEFDGRIAACAVEELLTPGDAHAWVQAVMSRASSEDTASTASTTSMTGVDHDDVTEEEKVEKEEEELNVFAEKVFEASKTGAGHEDVTARGRNRHRHKFQRFRLTHRRDCPRIGTFAIAMAPRHAETGQLCESSSLSWVRVSVMMLEESSDDPGRTVVTQVTRLADAPDGDQQLAASRVFLRELTRTVELFRTEPVQEAIVRPASYIIVSLRKCAKGTPLLPVWYCSADTGGEPMLDWVATEVCNGMKVSLPEYLLQFLARINVTTVGIFGALDGLQLMPYQAAVQEEAWAPAWAALEEPFRMQRSAYRHIYGGSGAPVLTISSEPRFMRPSEAQLWLSEPKTSVNAAGPEPMRIPVAITSGDFDAASGSPLNISIQVDEAFL